jgi:hypothetical protein
MSRAAGDEGSVWCCASGTQQGCMQLHLRHINSLPLPVSMSMDVTVMY